MVCFHANHAQGTNDEIFLPFPEDLKEEQPPPTITESDRNLTKIKSILTTSKETEIAKPDLMIEKNGLKPKTDDVVLALPKAKKKKKGKGDGLDPTEPPFLRGKALLTRNQNKSAESEFADSYTKEGTKANPSRTENTNLFGLDGKNKEGEGLVEKIEDPDSKIKAQFELARSLDRLGSPESEEKAYKEYLKIVTTFPVHPEITPRTHMAISILLLRKQEYRPALHHLVKVIKEFKSSKEYSPAYYYSARIYESAWKDRDMERAKRYYDLYIKESDSRDVTPGYDFRKDAIERRNLIESPIGI